MKRLSPAGARLTARVLSLALAVAMNTAKLGMQGFSEALAESDPAKFAEAVGKLAPAARDTALAVRSLAPAWTELRLDVQGRLFANLGIINDWPPLFSAAFPLAAFLGMAFALLWWLERR